MSHFVRELERGRFPVTLEITPPRRVRREILLRRAGAIHMRADAVNVIHRPDRVSSLEAALELCEAGVDAVWHLAVRGRSRAGIEADIVVARNGGIRSMLCVRGDHGAPDVSDTPKIREVVAMVRRQAPEIAVGVTFDPSIRTESAVANLRAKIRAGARFVQTQPVFDRNAFRASIEAWRGEAPGAYLVPMVMPIVSPDALRQIRKRLAVPVPAEVDARLARGGEEAGWALFQETVRGLRDDGLADGLAVMTLAMDPPAPFLERLRRSLDHALR